ncbi:hypothetical protein HY632_02935 [Candidatus Uhrbacteria bacterium]|nr:hypothetical protein [Candidatus Uhrbacteria bacterium]
MRNSVRFPSGQGLLETTIAIGIIVTGLFAALTLAMANGRGSDAAALRFGAVQAAREGIEIARAMRDSNWLAGGVVPWDQGMTGSADQRYIAVAVLHPETRTWRFDFVEERFDQLGARLVRPREGSLPFWTQGVTSGAVDASPYRRLIAVYPICADGSIVRSGAPCDATQPVPGPKVGIRVQSRVAWEHRGRTESAVAEEDLYNWR